MPQAHESSKVSRRCASPVLQQDGMQKQRIGQLLQYLGSQSANAGT